MNVELSPFHSCQPTFPESDVLEKYNNLMPKDTVSSEAPDVFIKSKNPEPTAEYIHRIADLESRVRILK
jgi:hypothetical protein